jgi:hypothetical protein
MDSSLRLLVGEPDSPRDGGEAVQSAREELVEYMSRVCMGFEKAPSHVIASLDAALAVCQEWQSRPRGKDVPLPPPSARLERGASADGNTDYRPSPKSIAYNPCLPEPQSVLAMMAVRKVSNPQGSRREPVSAGPDSAEPATTPTPA